MPSASQPQLQEAYGPRSDGVRRSAALAIAAGLAAVGQHGHAGAERHSGVRRQASPHVHEGRPADPAALLSAVPSSGHVGADVADDLSGGAAVGAVDQAEGHARARCRRGTSIAASASTSPIRRCPIAEIATIAAWVDAGAPEGRAADAPPPRVFAIDVRVDLRRARSRSSAWRRASRFRPKGPTSSPRKSSIRSSPKIATSSGCRSSRTRRAPCITRTSTSICPKASTPTASASAWARTSATAWT